MFEARCLALLRPQSRRPKHGTMSISVALRGNGLKGEQKLTRRSQRPLLEDLLPRRLRIDVDIVVPRDYKTYVMPIGLKVPQLANARISFNRFEVFHGGRKQVFAIRHQYLPFGM